jgi:hypothetical protein
MLNKNTRIKVRNRNNGSVGYTIPDMNNLRRKFYPGEIKEVSFEELQKLSYTPGGMYMLNNYLVLDNEEAIRVLIGGVELEYAYTTEDIKKLLLNGSMDELLDCLDFAPAGVISLVKDLAVSLEINDLSKREAIQKKTGFNVNNAIKIKHENETPDAAPAVTTAARRVAQPTEGTSEAPVRRSVVKK